MKKEKETGVPSPAPTSSACFTTQDMTLTR